MTGWQSTERRLGAALTFLLKGRSCRERTVFEAVGKEHWNDENILPRPQPKNIFSPRWEGEACSFERQTLCKWELCAPVSSFIQEAADWFYKVHILKSAGVSSVCRPGKARWGIRVSVRPALAGIPQWSWKESWGSVCLSTANWGSTRERSVWSGDYRPKRGSPKNVFILVCFCGLLSMLTPQED